LAGSAFFSSFLGSSVVTYLISFFFGFVERKNEFERKKRAEQKNLLFRFALFVPHVAQLRSQFLLSVLFVFVWFFLSPAFSRFRFGACSQGSRCC
jgi:hypothetical protein